MTDQHNFTLKQIVWAKVSDYPWWPARIVKTLTQRCRNIYKVHFFGDLSYCYLQSQQLLDFESGFARLQDKHSTDLILKKSIQLAKTAFQKSKTKTCILYNHDQYFPEVQPTLVDSFQQTKLQSKPTIQPTPKCEQILQVNGQNKIDQPQLYEQLIDINTENVIEYISSTSFKQLKKSKGYNNRKQLLTLQLKFKEVLLAKYNLSDIPKTYLQQKSTTPHFHGRIHRRKNIIKQNKRHSLKNKDILRPSARKLFKIMKNVLGFTNNQAQFQIQKYFKHNHNAASKNRKQFARNYVNYVKYIIKNKKLPEFQQKFPNAYTVIVHCQQNIQNKGQIQMEQQIVDNHKKEQSQQQLIQNFIGSTMQLQDELKKEDEERSKITQIQGYSFSYTH